MSIFSSMDWRRVREHYDAREQAHLRLRELLREERTASFIDLLLGIEDAAGNYSAAEHGIGPKILAENLNVHRRLVQVAKDFVSLTNPHEVPPIIHKAGIKYFRIGVGSEASCMLNPTHCWVANVRTIWVHLVQKHDDDFGKADQELQLYRESDVGSEMAYQMWRSLHAELAGTITRTSEQGTRLARQSGVEPGKLTYLWADTMATELYGTHHSKNSMK